MAELDGDLSCQSGARWEQINDTLKEKGIPLFFPVRPLLLMHHCGLTLDSSTPVQEQ